MTVVDGGGPRPDERVRLRRWRRYYLLVGVVGVAVLTVTPVLGLMVTEPGLIQAVSGRFLVVTLGLPALFMVAILVLSWLVTSRSSLSGRLMRTGSPAENRRVSRDLRRGRPLPAEQRALAQALVDVHAQRGWLPILWLVLAVVWIAIALTSERDWWFWIRIALGVAYLCVAPRLWWTRRSVLRHAAEQGLTPTQQDR